MILFIFSIFSKLLVTPHQLLLLIINIYSLLLLIFYSGYCEVFDHFQVKCIAQPLQSFPFYSTEPHTSGGWGGVTLMIFMRAQP